MYYDSGNNYGHTIRYTGIGHLDMLLLSLCCYHYYYQRHSSITSVVRTRTNTVVQRTRLERNIFFLLHFQHVFRDLYMQPPLSVISLLLQTLLLLLLFFLLLLLLILFVIVEILIFIFLVLFHCYCYCRFTTLERITVILSYTELCS